MSGYSTGAQLFANFLSGNRLPGVSAQIDPSNANTAQPLQRSLIIGQVLGTSTLTRGQAAIAGGLGDVQAAAGPNSMLALMYARYRQQDPLGTVYLLPLADDPAATAATRTITTEGTSTAAGTLSTVIAGQLVPLLVTAGMTAAEVATALADAVNAAGTLPVVATVPSAAPTTVVLTAVNAGADAGDIDVRFNYLGPAGGQAFPPGITASVTASTAGTQNPTALATALAALGDMTFDFIAFPYNDTASIGDLADFESFSTGRWDPQEMLYGMGFGAYRGTFGAATTFGAALNTPFLTNLPFYDSPDPSFVVAADFCATSAVQQRINPAVPLQTLALAMQPPPAGSRFINQERNSLLYDGLSTFLVDDSGVCHIERAVTTYQTNAAGVVDDSYLDVETMGTLTYVCRDLKTTLDSQFAQKILVSDTTNIGNNTTLARAIDVKTAAIARYRYLESIGLVQNSDTFAQLVTASNIGNGQVQLMWPGDLANQLRQIGILVAFSKT